VYVTFSVSAEYYFFIFSKTSLTHKVLPIPGTPEISALNFVYINFQNNPENLNFISGSHKFSSFLHLYKKLHLKVYNLLADDPKQS